MPDPRETLSLRREDLAAYQRMTREQRMDYLRWRRELTAQTSDPLDPGAGPRYDTRASSWLARKELDAAEEPWIRDQEILDAADRAVHDVMTWQLGIEDEAAQLEQAIADHGYEQRDEVPELRERLALRQRILKLLAGGDVVERHALFRQYRDARIAPEAIKQAGEDFLGLGRKPEEPVEG